MGLTVYFGPPNTLAPVRSASRRRTETATDGALDALGAKCCFCVAFPFAPLLRPVRVADRHAHDRYRRMRAADGSNAGDPPAGANDHLPADLLAENPVGRADVTGDFGCGRRGLQSQSCLANGCGCLVDDGVLRGPAIGEGEVVAREVELDSDDVRV